MFKVFSKLTIAAMAVALGVSIPSHYAPAMAAGETKYISEVKVGMDKTVEGATKELLEEGYTILSKDGQYADLNYEAGSDAAFARGQKKVYLGYKTTTNPSEAITDLAVMNMRGGYSIRDYEQLMETRIKSEILPFVDRFIATLQEYRDNLNSPYEKNKARAQYMRSMLNKLFDDDTLGLMGDLLVNETKYELGDSAYNALSEEEKKQHADIVTIVMQANGKIMLSMETLLTKATDTKETSWIDRLEDNTLEALEDELIDQGVDITEVDATLDRMYGDDAKKLLEKWDAFSHALLDYDEKANALVNIEEDEYDDKIAAMEKYDENVGIEENIMALTDSISARAEVTNTALDMELVAAKERMDEIDYDFDDGATLAEFFAQDSSVFNGDGIRNLYPIVASLSAGQLAGLDFLSIQDLVTIATADETSYDLNELGDAAPGSIYEGVNREIFEKGKVALTNKALRAEAMKNDVVKDNPLSTTTYILWGATAITSIAMVAQWAKFSEIYEPIRRVAKLKEAAIKTYENAVYGTDKLYDQVRAGKISCWDYQVECQKLYDAQADAMKALGAKNMDEALDNLDDMEEAIAPHLEKSRIAATLGALFTVAMAVLAAYSIYSTITELIDYYKVEYSPIPKYIVEETDITETVDGVTTVKRNDSAYYQVAECNRKPDSEFYDVLQNYADLNGDVGKQWLALYYVRQEGHAPIKADSLLVVKGTSNIPTGYSNLGIHNFERTANDLANKSKIASYLGFAFSVAMAVLAIVSIYSTFKELSDYYKVEYSPIPKYIVEETDITEEVNGVKTVKRNDSAYYQVAECNRKPGDDFYDVLQNYADLNGDVGKQWLALYYVRQEGHAPIKADSLLVVKGTSNIPTGYSNLGIHDFETENAYNLTSKYYCYNDPNNGTYVYFKVDESALPKASVAGSNFSTGTGFLFAGVGAVVGAGIAVAIMLVLAKRKETKVSE